MNTPVAPSAALEDARLLGRVARRDREAFSQLYDRYAGLLYSMAIRILNDPDEAGDVLREAFVQIWDSAPVYDPALAKPFHWVLTITRNKAIERLRALQRRYAFFAEIIDEKAVETGESSTTPAKVFTQKQTALVRGALATIPYEQRQAIEMAFLGGMTSEEIADSLGQPLGTLKARIRRGMLRLRESLREML